MFKEHTIDEDYLNVLHLDGLVWSMPPVHNEDKYSIDCTSSTISSHGTETDRIPVESVISRVSEQGGATGASLLAKKSYLGHTKLNI